MILIFQMYFTAYILKKNTANIEINLMSGDLFPLSVLLTGLHFLLSSCFNKVMYFAVFVSRSMVLSHSSTHLHINTVLSYTK